MREELIAIGDLRLDCGAQLTDVYQQVTLYGTPHADGSNVVLVEHALTGSGRVAEWWPGIVGDGALFDPQQWCVIGINALGSCYGSSSAVSERLTVRDIVRAEMRALDVLEIPYAEIVIGGSLGGMRALQWALDAPARIGRAVAIGAHDHHSAMGIALNALQREAVKIDPRSGLRLARKIALLTYKSDDLLAQRHDRRPDRRGRECFDVEGYLEYQADLFEPRMEARSYIALTHAMDSFDVRDFLVPETAPPLIFVGITSDWLFRPQDIRLAVQRFVERGVDARFVEFRSDHGHDAFLAEPRALRALLKPFTSVAHAQR